MNTIVKYSEHIDQNGINGHYLQVSTDSIDTYNSWYTMLKSIYAVISETTTIEFSEYHRKQGYRLYNLWSVW